MPPPLDPSRLATKPRDLADWLVQPSTIVRLGVILIVALYARTIGFDFVYDDLTISVSPLIQSWHGVLDAFKMDVFGTAQAAGTSYYRPMSSALIVIIARLTSATPAWFHLAALFLALISLFLSYSLGRLLFEDDLLAALTALLFAVHPTKVETTAWIGSAACDGQAAIYFFAVLICYLRWTKSRNIAWMAASAAFFAAALFTKETMVVLSALVAIHCWITSPRNVRLRTSGALMVPYIFVLGLYAAARHAVLRPLPVSSIAVQPTFTLVNLWSAPLALWWYLKRLLYPSGLSILYDSIVVREPSFRNFGLSLIALLILLAAFAWIVRRGVSWRVPFFAAWFLLTLAPPLVLSPRVTVHDRYLQLAAYPFCVLLAYGILWVARRLPAWRLVAAVAAFTLVFAWSLSTWHEASYWSDSLTLWRRAVQIAPHNINARVELARLYSTKELPVAIRELDDGLRVMPDSPGLWRFRGLLLFNAGDYENSRTSLLRSLDVSARFQGGPQPEPTDVKFGRAMAAFYLGEIEMLEGKPDAADPWLRMAIDIAPDDLDYERVMVSNLRKQGLNEEADRRQKIVDALLEQNSPKK
jgi:tetratricopeptide (TPR) repeat protein